MTRRRHRRSPGSTAPRRSPARARYTAEIALPGLAHAGDRRRDDRRAAASPAIDAGAALRRRRRARRPHPREPAGAIAGAAAPAAVAARAGRARARASSRCRTTSCTTPASRSRSSSPTRTSARSTPRRSCGVEYERDALGHDDRRGPRRGLRGRAAVRRADARRATSAATSTRRSRAADVRVDAAYRMAANHHNPIEAPSTIAVWDDDRLTIYESTHGRPRHPAHRRPAARPAAVARPRDHAVRRRRLRDEGDGLAARDADRDGRAPRRPAGAARCSRGRRCSRRTGTARSRSSGSRSARRATGRLTAIRHEKLSITSPFDDWAEPATGVSLAAVRVRATTAACTG